MTLIIGGLCLLLGGIVWAAGRSTPSDYGVVEPARSSPGGAASGTVSASPSVPTPAPLPPGGDATLPGEPTALHIPALGVSATVVDVDLSGGVLGVPVNPADVGWWVGSALAGSAEGTVVLDGHVDSAVRGPGALFRLKALSAGDVLEVDTVARRISYTVVGRRALPKSSPLPADLFSPTGPARLVVITCGGPFDRRVRSYEDNVAIIAAPRQLQ